MAGPGIQVGFRVILWPVVFVFDQEPNWRPKSHTVFKAGLNMNKVFLISLECGRCSILLCGKIRDKCTNRCCEVALTRSSTAELNLNVLRRQLQALSDVQYQ
jgi:hypothetical protein